MKNILKWLLAKSSHQSVGDYHQIFTDNHQPIIALSPEGNIIQCNDAALTLYALSPVDLLNKNYFSVCLKFGIHPAFSSIEKMIESPPITHTTLIPQKLGVPRIMQWTTTVFTRQGKPGNICLQGFDITDISNISISAKKLQHSIIDHLPNHFIFWKDRHSIYLGCNRAFSTSLGFHSPSDVIGKSDYDLPVKRENSDAYIADDKQVMASKKSKLNIEEPQVFENGETKILLTSKMPLMDEQGEVYGVLAIYSDITEQKRNEQKLVEANKKIEESYRVKSEFIRNMSHDIRTPLSGIQQTARAISDGIIPKADIPEYAFAVWEASNNLMDLFNKIIEVSKNEQYDFEDNMVKFDLYELLSNLKKTYDVIAKHKHIAFDVEYANNVPQYLLGKHFRLHRILMNLLGNALKFTDKGSVKLLIEKSQESDKNVILRFSVIDTGIGIAADKHSLIFQPFTRLSPAFTGQYPGSGLGLHVVKDYVEKMLGEIYLESAVGEGSMFSCVLPFKWPMLNNDNDIVEFENIESPFSNAITALKQPSQEIESVIDQNNTCAKRRVLLVEDYELALNIGALILRNLGYEVDVATSGEEALALTEKNPYDLIYIDIGLPGIDGIETIRRVRASSHNPNQHAFVVALTAHADDYISDQCMSAGMQEIIFKPLSPEKAQQVHRLHFQLK